MEGSWPETPDPEPQAAEWPDPRSVFSSSECWSFFLCIFKLKQFCDFFLLQATILGVRCSRPSPAGAWPGGERQLNQNMTPVPHQVEENHCFGATVSRIKITKKSCPTSNLPFISQNNLVFPAAVRHHARHRAGWSVPLRSLPLPQVNQLWFCHGSSGEPTKNSIVWNSPKMGGLLVP